jgi:LAO/AO transport system kinase
MLLCEAAGFDVILVETVGVGQSEVVVHDMVDFFLLLMLAGAGDELQGIKKGIVEMADLIAITKADGANKQAAAEAKVSYQNALHLLTPQELWQAPVVTCSALDHEGLDEIWSLVEEHQQVTAGLKLSRRSQQRLVWLQDCIKLQLDRFIDHHPQLKDHLTAMEGQVAEGSLLPARAAQELLQGILKK